MSDLGLMTAILDSLKDPLLFADTDHAIRYMNKAAIEHYEEGDALIGTSLMDCHNPRSQATIREVLEAMQKGEDERLIAGRGRSLTSTSRMPRTESSPSFTITERVQTRAESGARQTTLSPAAPSGKLPDVASYQ